MKHCLIFLLLIANLYGCRKADRSNTHVFGKVIDVDTKQPVSGMPITISYKSGTAGIGLGLNQNNMLSTNSDKDGNYAFSFDALSNNSHNDYYHFSGSGLESYFDSEVDTAADDINNKASRVDIVCSSRIYANIHLVHTGSANPDDYISLSIGPYPFPYKPITSIIVHDTAAEVIARAETVPNHPTILMYTIRRSSVLSAQKTDSVVFTRDHEDYTILY